MVVHLPSVICHLSFEFLWQPLARTVLWAGVCLASQWQEINLTGKWQISNGLPFAICPLPFEL